MSHVWFINFIHHCDICGKILQSIQNAHHVNKHWFTVIVIVHTVEKEMSVIVNWHHW